MSAIGQGASPTRIGRYEILERIGKGAMGVVYSARDAVMDRIVAIKVMMADLEGEPETRTRFYREAQAAGRLLHPNIITIFDMGEDEGRVYIVMELLRGATLGEYLKQPGGVSLEQKVDLMMQVCGGLAAAHAHAIFHRDIKPGNLFVQQDGTLKVLDFGVARLASSTMTASGFIIGTPDYMSPEQARGREIDQRSDIFSAAGVFYYMLSGRKPFAAPDLPTVLRKVQAEDPPPLGENEAPAPLFRIVNRSLMKDPAHRHQSMTDLQADLARFKRHWDAETRQIAAGAKERYGAIQALLAEGRELGHWLGLPGEAVEEPAAARRLREDYGSFVDQGQDALLLVPFTRSAITDIAANLCAAHQPLPQQVERLRGARQAFVEVERLLAQDRPAEALTAVEAAASLVPDAPRVAVERERCRMAVAERQVRDARLAALAAEAQTAAAVGNWPSVHALCDEALGLDPHADALLRLRTEAREAIDREARVRAEGQRRAVERARRAIVDRRFDVASEQIALARELDVPGEEVGALEAQLADEQRVAAAETALAHRAAETIAAARAAFQDGRRNEAIAQLQACLDVEPEAPGVRRELDYIVAEARRLEEVERRRAQVATHVARARDAYEAALFSEAVEAASQALALEPGNADAATVQGMAQARQRAEADARERRARIAEHLERARALVESGGWAKASREAQRVLDLEPGNSEALELLVQIGRREAEQRAARERARQERERDRLGQQEAKAARQALRAGHPDEAEAAARRLLVLAPDDQDARGMLEEVELLRQRQADAGRVREDDGTVNMPGSMATDDDTVEMPVPPERRPVLGDRIAAVVTALRTVWRRPG